MVIMFIHHALGPSDRHGPSTDAFHQALNVNETVKCSGRGRDDIRV